MSTSAQTAAPNTNPQPVISDELASQLSGTISSLVNQFQNAQASAATPAQQPVQPKTDSIESNHAAQMAAFLNTGNDEAATKMIENNKEVFAQTSKRVREVYQNGLPGVTRLGYAVEENAWLAYPTAIGKGFLAIGAGWGLWQVGAKVLSWFR